jgi:hypothetical protein
LVIDCTTTGASPPTVTPPTVTPTDRRRGKGEEKYPVMPAVQFDIFLGLEVADAILLVNGDAV